MNSNKIGNDKIELVRCPHDCSNIELILAEINRFFQEATQYHYAKEYQFSIASLKKAFEKTFELRKIEEQECAIFFRSVITESLSNIHRELRIMTSGFFRKNHHKVSLIVAENMLKLFKMETPAGKLRNIMGNSIS